MAHQNRGRRSQLLHREVNLRIREITGSFPANGPVDFLCECGQDSCAVTIQLTEPQWDAVARDGDCILLASEHAEAVNGRRVVAENGRFLLVAAE